MRAPGLFFALCATCTCLLSSCGFGSAGQSTVTTCVKADDQASTFNGAWPALPLPLALQAAGNWSADELEAIVNAIESWNAFHTETRKVALFDAGTSSSIKTSTQEPLSQICSAGILSGTDYSGVAVIYKISNWIADDQVIGLTSYCPVSGTPYNRITNAKLELNYRDYFVEGKRVPDLQSIILHELGHMIGLNHSCEKGSVTAGVPDCDQVGLSFEYSSAVMYPVVFFPDTLNGEKRRTLQPNDQGRANCLYESLMPGS